MVHIKRYLNKVRELGNDQAKLISVAGRLEVLILTSGSLDLSLSRFSSTASTLEQGLYQR